jgi:hypothetical protein
MSARKPPQAWFWSYDIKPDNIDSVLLGVRLMRLSSYHIGAKQRFAALMYEEPGPARSYALLLDAAAAAKLLKETGERPVAVTVDATAGAPRFSLVLETGPGLMASLHLDLDESGARALADGQHAIADLATYTAGGARRFAAVVEERTAQSWVFTGVTAAELDARLLEHGAALVRVRRYDEGGRPLFAAVAERVDPGAWAWYAGLGTDDVARSLTKNKAFPVDLDAWWEGDRLQFCVVMYRDPKE